jgi:hypothetical protein
MSRKKPALGLDRGWGTGFAKKDMLEQEDRAGCRFEDKVIPPWSAQLSPNFPL